MTSRLEKIIDASFLMQETGYLLEPIQTFIKNQFLPCDQQRYQKHPEIVNVLADQISYLYELQCDLGSFGNTAYHLLHPQVQE